MKSVFVNFLAKRLGFTYNKQQEKETVASLLHRCLFLKSRACQNSRKTFLPGSNGPTSASSSAPGHRTQVEKGSPLRRTDAKGPSLDKPARKKKNLFL